MSQIQGVSASLSLPVSVPNGGTGDSSLTAHAVLLGEGTSPVAFAGPSSTSGIPLISQGSSSDPIFSANVNAARTIVTQSASATFALTDANTFQVCTKASSQVMTIPANASVAFPIGTEIDVWQQGVGPVSFVASGGVTIQSLSGDLSLSAQYTGASLKKIATDTWSLVGSLST